MIKSSENGLRSGFGEGQGHASEQVIVTSTNGLIEHSTVSVGHVIDRFDITRRALSYTFTLEMLAAYTLKFFEPFQSARQINRRVLKMEHASVSWVNRGK
jgi:hypothetical protein